MDVTSFVRRFLSQAAFFLYMAIVLGIPSARAAAPQLSSEQLAEVVEPGVVRIMRTVEGSIFVNPFYPDFNSGTIITKEGAPFEEPIKRNSGGSGFFITEEGHIMTNAHVVSLERIKDDFVETLVSDLEFLTAVWGPAPKAGEKKLTPLEKEAFREKLVEHIKANARYELKNEIKVIDPKATSTKPTEIIAASIPAVIVAESENFIENHRDIAVIKIDEANTPALSLATSSPVGVGKQVFVFGFPGSADIGGGSFLQSTFTTGLISSIKEDTENDLLLYQTDAKISSGSSGSPLFDKEGRVIGIISFYTEDSYGDGFSTAIPISVSEAVLDKAGVAPAVGDYAQRLSNGFAYLGEKRCGEAEKEFEAALLGASRFVNGEIVRKYIEECDALQAANQSIDTGWDAVQAWVVSQDSASYLIFALSISEGALLLVLILLMRRRLKKDEKELQVIEATLSKPVSSPGTVIIGPK